MLPTPPCLRNPLHRRAEFSSLFPFLFRDPEPRGLRACLSGRQNRILWQAQHEHFPGEHSAVGRISRLQVEPRVGGQWQNQIVMRPGCAQPDGHRYITSTKGSRTSRWYSLLRRVELVNHEVDDDAGDADVEPKGKGPFGDGAMLIELLGPGAAQGDEDEWDNDRRQD